MSSIAYSTTTSKRDVLGRFATDAEKREMADERLQHSDIFGVPCCVMVLGEERHRTHPSLSVIVCDNVFTHCQNNRRKIQEGEVRQVQMFITFGDHGVEIRGRGISAHT